MHLDEIRKYLESDNLKEVSRDTGIPYTTLRWIKNPTSNPTWNNIELLTKYYGGH